MIAGKKKSFLIFGIAIFLSLNCELYRYKYLEELVPTVEEIAQQEEQSEKEFQHYTKVFVVSGLAALLTLSGGLTLSERLKNPVWKDVVKIESYFITSMFFGMSVVMLLKRTYGKYTETYSKMLIKKFANDSELSSMIGFNQALAEHMPLNDFNRYAKQFMFFMEVVNFDLKCLKNLTLYFNKAAKPSFEFRVSSKEFVKNSVTKIAGSLFIFLSSLEQQLLRAGQVGVPSNYSEYPVNANNVNFPSNKGLVALDLPMIEAAYAVNRVENEFYLHSAKIHMNQLIADLSKIKGLVVSIADSLEDVYPGRSWIKSFVGVTKKVDSVLRLSADFVAMIVARPEYIKECARKKELAAIAHEEAMLNLERQKKAAEVATMNASAAKQEALAQDIQADAKKREAKARAQDVDTAGKVIGGVLSLFDKNQTNHSDRLRA